MAEVLIHKDRVEPPEPVAPPDHFVFTTERGFKITCGKPMGPLKLRLRNLLSLEEISEDREIVGIATAFLCIRDVSGERPKLANKLQFDAFLTNTFGSDTDINLFMNEYQKFSNPEMHEYIEASLKEALDAGCTSEDEITEFLKKRLMERAEAERDKVRL